ncbi:RNA-binding protein [archaeon]|jgi:exosome complex component RRP4|nr:RNA-binding protein [archaeon]MBT4242250.1 RNA-binding protein [archaeon]MBT4417938.1 RNA-binding protein [archaeon]
MDKEEIKQETSERKIVTPGEIIISAEDKLPGDFTRNEGGNIIANRYGLADTSNRVVKIIPISGVFEPRRGNTVIGRVEDITFNGWIIDIGTTSNAFLSLAECPRFIDRNNIAEFAAVGDVLSLKIYGVKAAGSIDLTLKSRGLGKLEGGRIIRINPHKVPRVIGKEGSMINLIKNSTKTEITVGQNGYIWVRGDVEGEKMAEEAIGLISKESMSSGLTEKVEEFLKSKGFGMGGSEQSSEGMTNADSKDSNNAEEGSSNSEELENSNITEDKTEEGDKE